ncbi:ABC transporter permease [Caldalkalibacillus salinus]|uniref:ABC transporter permease n=1 Tax=Caldalkalibacillus salinus TaxID=2803787 RepID=UPI0019216AFC|nr:ABC transporter permease [Caldalkalibacillus salinus]
MQSFKQLTLAQLKLFLRNKTVILWTTFFPLVLMVMLGLFLGNGGETSVTIGWYDEDQSASSDRIKSAFVETEVIDVHVLSTLEEGKQAVQDGDLSLMVGIPAGFGHQLEHGKQPTFDVYYDEVNQSVSEVGFALVDQVVDEINKEWGDFEEIVLTERKGLQSLQLTYLDFLVPGIAALMILSSNLNGVAAQIASWRERGILRRLQSTGLKASTFIAAQITARTALNLTQAILVLSVGIFVLGAQMNGHWLVLLFYLILGTLVFMSLGFIIASLAKTPEHAAPVAGFISFPMFFLGGIFFPISDMPGFLQPVVYAIPISHLSDVLRQVMNTGAGIIDLWVPTLILIAWFVVSFALASKFFRWEA